MRKRLKVIVSLLLCTIFLAGSMGMTMTTNAEDVKISEIDYKVSYNGASDMFLCNKSSIGSAVGTEVYLTYTVESVGECLATVHGVGATGQPETVYPYDTGTMNFTSNPKPVLLQEGYTYFYKFEVTEEGFTYTIIKAKGEEATYLDLPSTTGKMKDELSHFGIWLGGGKVTAELKNVRCYDREGNDLGIMFSRSHGVSCVKDVTYAKNANLNHSYKVTIEKQHSVALCSEEPTDAKTVYMEYKVASSKSNIIQMGAMITQDPTTIYPYSGGNGYMLCETMAEEGNGALLVPGAEYIICMEKKADGFEVTVQRTHKEEKEIFSFSAPAGTYGQQFKYFGLWLGTGTECLVDCVLTDFKCYDEENNNLGVQCNRPIQTEHSGEIEDYSGCEAVYYCKENDESIALYENKTMKITKEDVTREGTYYIDDATEKTITLSYGQGKEGYEYLYKRITREDGKVYERLGNYKVAFVTGTEDTIETQKLSAKNGYVVKEPEAPTMKKNTFVEWVTKDGEKYDFNTIVTESITLYAKWQDEEGRETIALSDSVLGGKSQKGIVMPIVSATILVGCSVGCVLLIRRGGKRHGKGE